MTGLTARGEIMRPVLIVLFFALLGACAPDPRHSSISINGKLLLEDWRCESPEAQAIAEMPRPDGTPADIAEKLLQCPFNRDYQLEAMDVSRNSTVGYDRLSEIVYKIRWGIDYQYGQFETALQGRQPRKGAIIRPILSILVKPVSALFSVVAEPENELVTLGSAAPVVIRQMQLDREKTGAEIARRLAAFKRGERQYTLWQAMLDLDVYYRAGTVSNALKTLHTKVTGDDALPGNI